VLFAIFFLAAVRSAAAMLEHAGYEITLWQDSAGKGYSVGQITLIVLGLILTASLIYFIYSLAGNRGSAILLLFLVSILMVYCSGGILSSVFLPEAIRKLGERLPTAYLIRAFGGVLTGYTPEVMKSCMLGMSVYTIFFCLGAWCARRINLNRI
jgi:uncharacterized phage infection (PIP) family protein YhgE